MDKGDIIVPKGIIGDSPRVPVTVTLEEDVIGQVKGKVPNFSKLVNNLLKLYIKKKLDPPKVKKRKPSRK